MFSLGWQEMIFIFVLALLLFGPKKLPEIARTMGKAISEFRRASNELKATFDRELSSLEQENHSIREATSEFSYDQYHYENSYESSYYDSGGRIPGLEETAAKDTTAVTASAAPEVESRPGTAPEGTVETAAPGTPHEGAPNEAAEAKPPEAKPAAESQS
jgi:TatA/E family protein of Tat protein translocase